jgi:alkylation response protein AidB-like acyl-CoA dehydrogenase
MAQEVDGFSLAMSGEAGPMFDGLVRAFGAAEDPVMRQDLSRLWSMRRAARLSGQRAAASAKASGQPGPEMSTLKLLGSAMARRTRDLGLEAMGADGMLWGDDAPERGLFHAYGMFTPALSIAGGTDEVQRNIIGERVLGLPREPGEQELRNTPWSELKRS